MFHRRYFPAALSGPVLAFAFVLALPVTAAAGVEDQADSFIRSLSHEAIGSLAQQGVTREVRIKRFRKMFNAHFNVRTIGKFVLGRYWKKANKKERTEYLGLFEDLMVVSYVDRFSRYAGENLNVTRTRSENARDATVFTQISRPAGQPVRVLWRVRAYGGTMKILDVIVEGASMSQTLRSDFGSIIRQKGGKVSGLLDVLRVKTAALENTGQ